MEGTFIEVQAWGDTTRVTVAIFYTPEERDIKSITDAFCSINGLPGLNGLPYNMLDDATEEFIKYLEKEGFKQIKTKIVCFND